MPGCVQSERNVTEEDESIVRVDFRKKCRIKTEEERTDYPQTSEIIDKKQLKEVTRIQLNEFCARLKDNVIISKQLDGSYEIKLKETKIYVRPQSTKNHRNFGHAQKLPYKADIVITSKLTLDQSVMAFINFVESESYGDLVSGSYKGSHVFLYRNNRGFERLYQLEQAVYNPRKWHRGLKGVKLPQIS